MAESQPERQLLPDVSFVYASTRGRDLQQKCSEEELDHFYELIAVIAADGDWDKINKTVHPLGSRLHELRDLQGLDAFHHAILAHNMTAIHYFHHYNLFTPPHNPESNPYLHLAANVGFTTAIRSLQQVHVSDYIRCAPLQIPYYLLREPLLTLVRKKFTRIAEKPASKSPNNPKDALNNPEDAMSITKDAFTNSNDAFADLEDALTKTKDLLESTANESVNTSVPKAVVNAIENGSEFELSPLSSATLDRSCALRDSGFSELHAQVDSPRVGPSGESTTSSPGDSAGADSEAIELLEEEEEEDGESRISQREESVTLSQQEQSREDAPFDEQNQNLTPSQQEQSREDASFDEQDQEYYNNFLHNMYIEDHDLLVKFEARTPADHAVRSQQVEALEALLTAKHHLDLVAAATKNPDLGRRRRRSAEAERQSTLELAAKSVELFHSPAQALRLLLEAFASKSQSDTSPSPPCPPGLNEALLLSIHDLQADCVRVLAEFGADHALAWSGRNCLHYLYSYTFGTAFTIQNKSLGYLETTRALVECLKVPVNCDEPLGSQPLYAFVNEMGDMILIVIRDLFLSSAKSSVASSMLDSIADSPVFQTIEYLLDAGSKPNLNEILMKRERLKLDNYPQVMYGRNLFPSALAAFYNSFSNRNWSGFNSGIDGLQAPIRKYTFPWIFSVTELLVRAGAKVEDYAEEEEEDENQNIDSEDLITFNIFVRDVLLNAISEGSIDSGTFIAKTLLLLLRCGVNLNRSEHAIWLERFCRWAVQRLSFAIFIRHFNDDSKEDLEPGFLDGVVAAEMENSDFYHCVVIILDHSSREKAKKMIDGFVSKDASTTFKETSIRKALLKLIAGPVNEIRSLISLSASASWAAVGRSESRLLEMNLPAGLSSVICRSFEPSFYGLTVDRDMDAIF